MAPTPSAAQAVTQEEALRLAFPGADDIQRRTAYLDEAQLARASTLAGPEAKVESGVVTYYVASKDGSPLGAAYFDVHRVRTLPEVLMFVVGPDHRIRRIEVVRFSEPPEYAPPEGWLAQFPGHALDVELSHKRGIANITGATLTARAVVSASRRVLAIHQVVSPFAGGNR
jgi:Na+-translocating ferredoxin:NAD+ oxidoreductase RnfG subunit